MGGCYSGSYRSECRSYSPPVPNWEKKLKEALKKSDRKTLAEAFNEFSESNKTGFILQAARMLGINDVAKIPKEFADIEYEVKFDIQIEGAGKEPGLEEYLDAFDFPAVRNARFLKDPVNTVATGVNRFYGDDNDEELVVITKGNATYLKEKGKVIPLDVGVRFQELVIKRTESRYASDIDKTVDKIAEVSKRCNYRGRIRKEKGDAFILDASDGRIYSFTMTRAHLIKAGSDKESDVQRQLEIEYAGFLPGFDGMKKDSEKQIVEGMVDLARYTFSLYSSFPISGKWRGQLTPTNERKYDFILSRKSARRKLKLDERLLPEHAS